MDLLIIETGDGGDALLQGNDLVMIEGVENAPYLFCFGGDTNWWGNDLIGPSDQEQLIISETEQILQKTILNSAGRIDIEQALQNDLSLLQKQTNAKILIQVFIVADDRCEILIQINDLQMQFIWDPIKKYLTYKL